MMRNATMLTPSRTGIAISRRQTTNRVMASLSGQGRGVEERESGHTEMEPGQVARGGEDATDIPQWQEDRGLHERVRDLLVLRGARGVVDHGVGVGDPAVYARIAVVRPVEPRR